MYNAKNSRITHISFFIRAREGILEEKYSASVK